MKIAVEKVYADKAGNLVPDGDPSAAILVSLAGLKVREAAIEKYPNKDEFFYDPDSLPVAVEDKNPLPAPFLKKNLLDTVSKLKGPGLAKLRSSLSGHRGIRLQSTGDAASASAITRIIMQTLDASPNNPYVVTLDQFILDPFTGLGQFDLLERDSSDEAGGESEVTIATKAGFTDGTTTGSWSRLVKAITSDKVYSVVFVPGTAGDGIFSTNVRALYPSFIDPDQTPLPT